MSAAAEGVALPSAPPVPPQQHAGHEHHEHHADHAHPHRTRNAVDAPPARPARTSLLMASAGLRLGGALALIAALWVAVAWALSGTP